MKMKYVVFILIVDVVFAVALAMVKPVLAAGIDIQGTVEGLNWQAQAARARAKPAANHADWIVVLKAVKEGGQYTEFNVNAPIPPGAMRDFDNPYVVYTQPSDFMRFLRAEKRFLVMKRMWAKTKQAGRVPAVGYLHEVLDTD